MFAKYLEACLPVEQQDALILKAKQHAQALLTDIGPFEILLFGSAAKKQMTSYSDLDFIVILDNQIYVDEASKRLSKISTKLAWPIDWLVFDLATFVNKSQTGGVCFTAKKEGTVVVSRETSIV